MKLGENTLKNTLVVPSWFGLATTNIITDRFVPEDAVYYCDANGRIHYYKRQDPKLSVGDSD